MSDDKTLLVPYFAGEFECYMNNKYIVDTCIINKLVDGVLSVEDLPQDGEYFSTHLQVDELNKTKDDERRARLFLAFVKQKSNIIATQTTVLGISRLNNCCLGNGETYQKIKKAIFRML